MATNKKAVQVELIKGWVPLFIFVSHFTPFFSTTTLPHHYHNEMKFYFYHSTIFFKYAMLSVIYDDIVHHSYAHSTYIFVDSKINAFTCHHKYIAHITTIWATHTQFQHLKLFCKSIFRTATFYQVEHSRNRLCSIWRVSCRRAISTSLFYECSSTF